LGVADRVYFVEKGQIMWNGTAEEAGDPAVISRYLSV
jgi:ABC-type branched-subunit amino acid transport system ATPase component